MAVKVNILKGDTVVIRRGKEKGKRGVVKTVHPGSLMVVVEGVNVVKRHTKQGSQSQNMGGKAQTGGIMEKEAPLPISALQYVCEKCKVPSRIRHSQTTDGKKHRVCAKCGEPARDSAKGA
jgi:large subunit ribosomal protein L24